MTGDVLGFKEAPAEQIKAWVEQFDRDGFLFLRGVLPLDLVGELRRDLDRALEKAPCENPDIEIICRMFESSAANLRLFDMEPIASFAEALVENTCHVIHNNSFRTPPGKGILAWHQDDAPHYLVTSGEAPQNIKLPVLLFSANYYLTDVGEIKDGPTEVVRGSHLLGKSPPVDVANSPWKDRIVPCLGQAGSVVMFNNQVWHRGAPNLSEKKRYVTQVSYARRLIGHKYFPFMNYQMPEPVYAGASPRLRRLLGFLPTGNYG